MTSKVAPIDIEVKIFIDNNFNLFSLQMKKQKNKALEFSKMLL